MLSNTEFYQALGDRELLEQYQSNRTKKTTSNILLIGGTVGTFISLTWMTLETIIPGMFSLLFGALAHGDEDRFKFSTVPLTLFAVSGVYLISGFIIAPKTVHPLTVKEATDRINTYNNSLKQELGLPPDYPSSTSSSRFQYDLNLVANSDSAQLRLTLDF